MEKMNELLWVIRIELDVKEEDSNKVESFNPVNKGLIPFERVDIG